MTTAPDARDRPSSVRHIGIVGAGQLARMTYQAGISLGLTVRLLAEHADDSAARVGADVMLGSPQALRRLANFAAGCDVVTFDHELIDIAAITALEASGSVFRPSSAVLALAQNKRRQREDLATLGLPVPPFRLVQTLEDVCAFAADQGWPIILKSARGGYDGRGVWLVTDPDAASTVLEQAAPPHLDLLAERHVPIERELAVLVARRPSGQAVVYPVVETVQIGGICREVLAPAPIPEALRCQAQDLAIRIAAAIDVTGVLAVELFQTDGTLLVNELATRPHNSGHYSIEGCVTSQFENHLRAIADWPLGDPSLVAPAVVMANVLGDPSGTDPRSHLPLALAKPDLHVHLYGKAARPGRKLGHVTVVGTDLADTRRRAQEGAQLLACGRPGEEPK
ncbi:MAG TPA: 5-(carboxyamino)imidazole ribonucleotide synthase [Chloroflexota bacterium]